MPRLPQFVNRHGEFIGHVMTMISGRSVAAAIALFTTPIVARLFTPDDFGVAAVFVSLIGIGALVASLKYEAAIPLPRSDDEASMIAVVARCAAAAVCALLLVLVAIGHFFGASFAIFEMLSYWVWLIPIVMFAQTWVDVQESWLSRKKEFRKVAVSLVANNTTTSGTRILFGLTSGSSVFGLITGYILGTVVRLFLQRDPRGRPERRGLDSLSRDSVWATAKDYADFPKLSAPAALVFTLGSNLPVLFFASMFSAGVAGMYAMANRLVQVPTTILATSVKRVFLQKAASIANSGRSIRKAYLLTTGGLALLAIGPVLCLWLYGQPMLEWLLGDNWSQAGRFLEILAPWVMAIWVTAPANSVFVVLRKQKFWLWLQSLLTLLRLGAFGLAYWYSWTAETALEAFVIMTVLGNILTIGITVSILKDRPIEAFDDPS